MQNELESVALESVAKESSPQEQQLQQLVNDACRAQPLLRAPARLQTNVRLAIEQRARQWWRAPVRAWPVWAQVLLLLLCVLSGWLTVNAAQQLGGGGAMQQWLLLPWALCWSLIDAFINLASVLRELLWLTLRINPVAWLLAMLVSGVAVAIGVMGLSRLAPRRV